ncbi:MAG: HEAT repeat domain-containing protein [Gemmatimonadota bacterium]
MTESEGKKLEGLARSIDALFSGESAAATPEAEVTPTIPEPELLDVTGVDFTTGDLEGSAEGAWFEEPVGAEDPPGGDIDLAAMGEFDLEMPAEPATLETPAPEPLPLPEMSEPEPPPLPEMAEPEPPPLPEMAEPEPPPLPEMAEPEPPPLPEMAEPEPPPPPEMAEPEAPPLPEVAEPEPPPLPEMAEPEPDDPAPMETELGLQGIGTLAPADVEPALAATGMVAAIPADGARDVELDYEPTPLDAAVDAYLGGDAGQASEIQSLAADFIGRQELDPAARAVERLIMEAGDPPDTQLVELAGSIMPMRVLERVVRRMGSERTEERRSDYYRLCSTLGEEMAEAIKNELGETTTDRLARRIYCEALTEMGPVGRAKIESMIDDDNQFIVRNAVSILGDIGGDNAVELVTSALANSDRRVRREALKSLAKLGDPAAGEWVLGFLDDPDEEVRMAAAVASGELKVGRALRPLLTMLDEAKSSDQSVPIIRALGHIGDPGAVPSLEKFAVPGLLRRPSTDVRIAAYRALHQIGTPHAKQLLIDVAKDKDEDVKDAVKGMLYG